METQLTFEQLTPTRDDATPELLPMPDAEVYFYRSFFSREESDAFYAELLHNTDWAQEKIWLYGKQHDVPRLTAWYGDPRTTYAYSGLTLEPGAWTAALTAIKERVEGATGTRFNSVLLNLYRDGKDSVARHSDNEAAFGHRPIIASVTFGQARPFVFRHKHNKDLRLRMELPHGSLLLMQGPTQQCWLHEVPKTIRSAQPRINLTFRQIHLS